MSNSTKTALVTGANRGLGLETARELARQSWQVILTARNEKKGTAAAQSVSAEAGREVQFRLLDIADPSSMAREHPLVALRIMTRIAGVLARRIGRVDSGSVSDRGKLHGQFVVDLIQGGAGTSTNMNANEVIANRALELLGRKKGEYKRCHPNDHVNLSQSTNDAYPTALKIAIMFDNQKLIEQLGQLAESFVAKGRQFSNVIKMGRTQLQDAVPMTLGQEFSAYGATLREEIDRLGQNARLFLETDAGP